jgi:hypothetical protein
MGALVLFPILAEKFFFFTVEFHVSCGLVINGIIMSGKFLLYTVCSECFLFNHERMLNLFM